MLVSAVRKQNIFRIVLLIYFVYLLLGRLTYLNSDSPVWEFNTEEKATAYNARNKVLFGDWSSGGRDYEPMVSSPLPNLVSYISFLLLGISLFSLRFPYALLSVLAIFIFYRVLKKETGTLFAFFGIALFSSINLIILLNRSATVENLFILFMTLALFYFQDYAENKNGLSIFLCGLFSALNLSVKYSSISFLFISAAAVLIASFSRGRGYAAIVRLYSVFIAGAMIGLILPGLALFFGRATGALEAIKFQCESTSYFNRDLVLRNIKIVYPLFFIQFFSFISLIVIMGLSSMVSLNARKLSKTDIFVLLWLILGSVSALFGLLHYKRLIFLLIPAVYITVKGGYGMWQYLKESGRILCYREGINLRRGKGVAQSIRMIIFWCLILIALPSVAKYILFLYGYGKAGFIGLVLLSSFIILPMARGAYSYFTTRDFHLAVVSLERWFVGACFTFFIILSIISILTNEINNANHIFNKKNHEFLSFEGSRDLGRILKANTAIIGSEMVFRILGFENRCKFIFNHDGWRPYNWDIEDIISRDDIRYFCLFLDEKNPITILQFNSGLDKIRSVYLNLELVKGYKFRHQYYAIYDKYPYMDKGLLMGQ